MEHLQRFRRTGRGLQVWLTASLPIAGLLMWATAGPLAQARDQNSGAYLYRTFCSSCHGETGRGNGPAADLTDPPASDLTTLTRRNGGVFPRERVLHILDGTSPIRGHDGPGMPDWSKVLQQTERGDERAIRQRLDALVSHVEVLQGGQ